MFAADMAARIKNPEVKGTTLGGTESFRDPPLLPVCNGARHQFTRGGRIAEQRSPPVHKGGRIAEQHRRAALLADRTANG